MNKEEKIQLIRDNKHLFGGLGPELQRMLEDMISPPPEEDSAAMRKEISSLLTVLVSL